MVLAYKKISNFHRSSTQDFQNTIDRFYGILLVDMRTSTLFAVVSAPLMALAAPILIERQGTSKFCTRITPAPSAEETEKRFNEFADLFLVEKDVYKAFEYILPEYIVRLWNTCYVIQLQTRLT